ncbi:hypothetical protein [Achromobacter ruhlandii]|uniref:hypothetical protein n=1 Tax=Achromobacter ruhlandii TaxID=72557 RepID=UPI001EEDCE99|nr:hypothetical protein [Achromobacter ruhlandii]
MTSQNNAAQAANDNPLSDEYVNAIIQRHGYDSPESVIAQLHQWIGLHGDEDTVTLLMYEAHKVLSQLRAPVADEPPSGTRWPVLRAMARNYTAGTHTWDALDAEACEQAAEEIRHLRAALASAPVAGEAVAWKIYDAALGKHILTENPKVADMLLREGGNTVRPLVYGDAAPQASEAVRDALMAFDEAMSLCGDFPELQHHRDALLFAVQKARAALKQPQADKDGCTCPSGDGSLRHPCAALPAKASGNGGQEWSDS